jgi:hypothetical protein
MSELIITNTIDLLGETIAENLALHSTIEALKQYARQQELKVRLKTKAISAVTSELIDASHELLMLHREVIELKSIISEMSEWYGTQGVAGE